MKKIWYPLVLMMMFTSLMHAQDWRMAVEQTYPPLDEIFFVNDTHGWIAGQDETLLRTTDGGITWEMYQTGADTSLTALHFFDENVGYIAGEEQVLYKTTDGGVTLTNIPVSFTEGDIENIYFSDENHGWVLVSESKHGYVYYTADGGTTWTLQLDNPGGDLEDMHFASPNHGIVVGGGLGIVDIYYTTDGQNWTRSGLPTFPMGYTRTDIKGVYMSDDNNAYATGWGSSAAGLQPTIFLKTTNGGQSWEYMTQEENDRAYCNFYDIIFTDANTGYAVGGTGSEGSEVFKTTNAGVNWKEINAPFGFAVKNIAAFGNKIIMAGSGGSIAVTEDGGTTWELITQIPGITLYDFEFVSENVAYAGGYSGGFLKTTDGGATWKGYFAALEGRCPSINDMCWLDENTGFLARNNKGLTKTTDGGLTWTFIMPDTSITGFVNYGVDFIDENLGYVCGKAGTNVDVIYKTTDGGATWDMKMNTYFRDLSSIAFFDANHGVVVGGDYTFGYTTDGGNTWGYADLVGVPDGQEESDVDHVMFYDGQLGFASAGDNVFRTTDGGKTWNFVEVSVMDKNIEQIAAADANTIWGAGGYSSGYYIIKSEDGGLNWNDVTDREVIPAVSLSSITVDPNGHPWIGGGNSYIFTTAPLTDVNDYDPTVPESFFLDQNYPNPFNPVTNIHFGLDKEANVSLNVYNVLGQYVTTLDEGTKQAGQYNVSFDATELSSGMYFYVLSVGSKQLTRKMILLK